MPVPNFNPKELDLNEEFLAAFQLMEHTTESAFITGKAGTGKSTLLKYFKTATHKNVVIVAPTGVAAINIEGQTIHSFFRFPPRLIIPEDVRKSYNAKILKKMDVLIIDEVSMVRADLLDGIDASLRVNRNSREPFGGVQVILFGDMFQLPPVVREDIKQYLSENYDSPYFFSAKVFAKMDFKTIELHTVYRQPEAKFVSLLNKIRMNTMTEEDLDLINSRVAPQTPESGEDSVLTLTTTNAIAERMNSTRLGAIKSPLFTYKADISGDFEETVFPTQPLLLLKVGAQVMFLRNDPQKRWVNGTLGKVSYLSKHSIKVTVGDFERAQEHALEHEVQLGSWEKIKYYYDEENKRIDAKVTGTFKQFPLKLAWAITIHKSQGQTFDRVMIDLGHGAFAHGQAYVALSRCRTLEGITLKRRLAPRDIIFDEQVLGFKNNFVFD